MTTTHPPGLKAAPQTADTASMDVERENAFLRQELAQTRALLKKIVEHVEEVVERVAAERLVLEAEDIIRAAAEAPPTLA